MIYKVNSVTTRDSECDNFTNNPNFLIAIIWYICCKTNLYKKIIIITETEENGDAHTRQVNR